MKTLKNHWFLLCFEHLEVLEGALGVLGVAWGLLWDALGGPRMSLGGLWELPEESLRVLGEHLGALEGALGVLGGAWGLLWGALGGPGRSLGAP